MKLLIICMALFALVTNAHGHKPSDSYLNVKIQGSDIHVQWDMALRDLEYAIGLDADNDGKITWGELRARHAEIAAYALPRLEIRAGDAPCVTGIPAHYVDNHSDGAYTVLRFSATCSKAPQTLDIRYGLFFDLDPTHRGLLQVNWNNRTQTAIFSPDRPTQTIEMKAAQSWRLFLDFLREGIQHILRGFDHILFLLSLLLPAVLKCHAGKWQAVSSFQPAFLDVFKIVTAFTVAHSITLSLAALDIVHLPSRWVESVIAASIVLAAMNNVYPLFDGRRWLVAFFFGLIHGFGFAAVLADLGLPQGALLRALIGFNLGVEMGQIAIVGLFLPLAYALRQSWFYQRVALVPGSLLVAAIGFIWWVERMFDLKLFS